MGDAEADAVPPTSLTKKTLLRLRRFQVLPQRWHYGTGGPIHGGIVEQAVRLVAVLADRGFRTDTFPGGDGGILVSGCLRHDAADLRVEPAGCISLVYERDGEEVLDITGLHERDVLSELTGLLPQRWSRPARSCNGPGRVVILLRVALDSPGAGAAGGAAKKSDASRG